MTRDEALLLKQSDWRGVLARSNGDRSDKAESGPCTFSFHTAFDFLDQPKNVPDRLSIEVRCVVIYG